MATNKDILFDKTLNGSFWNAGVTFERTNPVPLEKYSIFKTLADAQDYAKNNAVSYLGQIITVISGEQTYSAWSFSDGSTHTATWNGTKWTIDGTPCTDAKQLPESLSITTGSITATRSITAPYDVANYKIVDTNGTLVQIDAVEIDPSRIQKASKEQYGVVKVGEGLDVVDGTISAQKLDVDQVINDSTKASSNPVSTSAVVEYGKTAYDAAGTAQGLVNALTANLPNQYLSVGVANSPDASDKLMKRTEVEAEIAKLDVAEFTTTQAESISSIQEVDGKIVVRKGLIQIAKDQVTGLAGDLTSINSKIAGLQTVSADHDAKINGLVQISGELDQAIKTEVTNRTTAVSELATQLDTKIKNITDNYALSNDVKSISSSLFDKIVADSAAAKAAGELSAQAVRNDLESKYIPLTAANTTVTDDNKVATMADVAGLAGVTHLRDTFENRDGNDKAYIVVNFTNIKKGDIFINTANSKEYLAKADGQDVANIIELGDESLYAKKSELNAHVEDTIVHITQEERTAWNAKTTSADVSAIANAYSEIEKARAEGAERDLKGHIDAISSQISAFTDDWKESVELSASALSAYAKGLSDDLGTEVTRAKAAEQKLAKDDEFLSAAISSTVYVESEGKKFNQLSVVKISKSEFDAKVGSGSPLQGNVLYIVDSNIIDAYGQQMKNLADPTELSDATNKKYVDDSLTATAHVLSTDYNTKIDAITSDKSVVKQIELNGLTFDIADNKATLNIDVISCGTAL